MKIEAQTRARLGQVVCRQDYVFWHVLNTYFPHIPKVNTLNAPLQIVFKVTIAVFKR